MKDYTELIAWLRAEAELSSYHSVDARLNEAADALGAISEVPCTRCEGSMIASEYTGFIGLYCDTCGLFLDATPEPETVNPLSLFMYAARTEAARLGQDPETWAWMDNDKRDVIRRAAENTEK